MLGFLKRWLFGEEKRVAPPTASPPRSGKSTARSSRHYRIEEPPPVGEVTDTDWHDWEASVSQLDSQLSQMDTQPMPLARQTPIDKKGSDEPDAYSGVRRRDR